MEAYFKEHPYSKYAHWFRTPALITLPNDPELRIEPIALHELCLRISSKTSTKNIDGFRAKSSFKAFWPFQQYICHQSMDVDVFLMEYLCSKDAVLRLPVKDIYRWNGIWILLKDISIQVLHIFEKCVCSTAQKRNGYCWTNSVSRCVPPA